MNDLDQAADAEQRDTIFHGKNHGEEGRDKVYHRLLGKLHSDTTAANPVRGDVIVAMGSDPKWGRYAILVPAANVRNAFAVDNGETEPTWKATLDGTAPTTIAPSDAATAGTSLIYSHRDHKHGAPATYPPTAHNVLSASHGDTLTDTVVAGDVIVGNATPKWSRLARSVPGSAGLLNVIGIANGETVPSWKAAEHALLSARHSDAVAGSPTRGDIVVANSTPAWTKLATGGSGTVLAGGTDPSYTANPSVTTITTTGAITIGGALDHNGTTVGFYGTAPTTILTVNGSRGGNVALASLLAILGAGGLGLLVDGSVV